MGYSNVIYYITDSIIVNEDGEKSKSYGIIGQDALGQVKYNDISTNKDVVENFVNLLNLTKTSTSNTKQIIMAVFSN